MESAGFVIKGTSWGSKIIKTSKNLQNTKMNLGNTEFRGGKDTKACGKSCYSISIKEQNIILSKFKVVLDKQRSLELGNVSLSIVIPHYSEMNGKKLKEKLDTLFERYTEQTVNSDDEFQDNSDETIFEELERNISTFSDFQLTGVTIPLKEKSNTTGFYYYEDESKLIDIFNNPYINEFYPFTDVLLIDKKEKESVNALNALKHDPTADLSDEIDIENRAYSLVLDVKDDINVIGLSGKESIKLNDHLDITFEKRNFKADQASYSGSLDQLLKDDSSIFQKDKSTPNKIIVKSPIFKPKEKEVTINFFDNEQKIDSNEVNYEINSDSKGATNKRISGDKVKFSGEEIDYSWELKIKKNDHFESKTLKISLQRDKLKVNLNPRKPPFNWAKAFMVIGLVIILGGGIYLAIEFWPFGNKENKQIDDEEKKDEEMVNHDQEAWEYMKGDKLFAHKLKEYKNQSVSDSVKEKLIKNERFRRSIDGNSKPQMQNVYDSLNLSSDKNRILEYILDSLDDFTLYKEIKNKSDIRIVNFLDSVKNHNESAQNSDSNNDADEGSNVLNETNATEPVEEEPSTDNVLQETEEVANDSETTSESPKSITESKFIKILFNNENEDNENKFDPYELTSNMKTIRKDYNSLSGAEKAQLQQHGIKELPKLKREINNFK